MTQKIKIMAGIAVIVLFMCIFFWTFNNNSAKEASRKLESDTFGDLSFYSDRILYTSCWGGLHASDYCRLVRYDVVTKESKIIHTTNDFQGRPIYSWDGKKIAYANVESEKDVSNICVMDADGSNQQQLTHDYSEGAKTTGTPTGKVKKVRYNHMPSFSRDGKRIIFARASMKRQRIMGYGDMYTSWDIFEIDLRTKAVKQLTNYRFYEISRPFYLPDDRRFIFWGTAPARPDLSLSAEKEFRENYRREYQDNNIFIMDGRTNDLRPAFTYGRWTSEPSVTRDGDILFLAITNEMDGLPPEPVNYDLFLKKGDTITRVTRNMGGRVKSPSISFDGKRILFKVVREEGGRSLAYRYMINSDGAGLTDSFGFPAIGPKKE